MSENTAPCPLCGMRLNRNLADGSQPRPEDVVICLHCGVLLVFLPVGYRAAMAVDLDGLPPSDRLALLRLQRDCQARNRKQSGS